MPAPLPTLSDVLDLVPRMRSLGVTHARMGTIELTLLPLPAPVVEQAGNEFQEETIDEEGTDRPLVTTPPSVRLRNHPANRPFMPEDDF